MRTFKPPAETMGSRSSPQRRAAASSRGCRYRSTTRTSTGARRSISRATRATSAPRRRSSREVPTHSLFTRTHSVPQAQQHPRRSFPLPLSHHLPTAFPHGAQARASTCRRTTARRPSTSRARVTIRSSRRRARTACFTAAPTLDAHQQRITPVDASSRCDAAPAAAAEEGRSPRRRRRRRHTP